MVAKVTTNNMMALGTSIKPAQKMLLSLQGMNSFKASDISNI
jgi:hypothetical protein